MAEKTVNEIQRDVRMLYQKGNDALLRENFDYAIDLYNQVLEKEPAFYDARKALRTAQARKAGGSTGFFKKMLSGAGASPLIAKGQLALRRNPVEALQIAEQILLSDPFSSPGHKLIVEAAKALEMPKTVVLSYEILVRNSPKDKALAIQFGYALADAGETSRAERVLVELSRNFAGDGEVTDALKDLSARKTLREGGYDALASGQGSYRDILRNEKEAVSLEQQNRVQKTENVAERLMTEYTARLQNEPNNLKLLRSMADLHRDQKNYDKALEFYQKAKATDTGASDPTLDKAISDLKVKQIEQRRTQLDPAAPDFAEKSAALDAEKLAFQITECQKRVEKFPTDLAIRFEMGELYFRAGRVNEAAPELQKAQANPHKRLAAMNLLAQCFAKKKMFDMAANTLRNAIKEKPVFDEEKKDLIYNLGSVLEATGKKEEAIEQFKLIYEIDMGYRDVGAKVDAYYASQ